MLMWVDDGATRTTTRSADDCMRGACTTSLIPSGELERGTSSPSIKSGTGVVLPLERGDPGPGNTCRPGDAARSTCAAALALL